MNVQRFVGQTARQAMSLARAACGDDALVLANRPVPGGIEILAMAAGGVPEPGDATAVSTLSFGAALQQRQREAEAPRRQAPAAGASRLPAEPGRFARESIEELTRQPVPLRELAPQPPRASVLDELRTLRSELSSQLSGLAWFDGARRSPAQVRLLRLVLANGFSPALARALVDKLPAEIPDAQSEFWLANLLAHNLRCAGESDGILHDGGVHALLGASGVGKTTAAAKIAARFAAQHGAAAVGLVTLDMQRGAGPETLRAAGRGLGIPVHTARDGASLAELLDLFTGKKLVLVDTVGGSPRDPRLPDLLASLPAGRIGRLAVLPAGAQGEALDEAARAYGATRCVVAKLDEAARCGAVVDVVLRHRLVVEGIGTGPRVPQDWHFARPLVMAQKALLRTGGAFAPDEADIGLLLTAPVRRGA